MKSQPDKISLKKIHAKNTSIEKKMNNLERFYAFQHINCYKRWN